MSTLNMILLACLAGGLISMAAAAAVVFRLSQQSTGVLVAFAAGVMLSSAFLHVLPEAFATLPPVDVHAGHDHDPHDQAAIAAEAAQGHDDGHGEHGHGGPQARLFAAMLATLFVFFALERLALWRHSHGDCAAHEGHHATVTAPLLILVGDAFHNFVDGILLAAAFIADPMLGVTTTVAIIAHEIPQEMGDFILLRNGGWSNAKAFVANAGSSLSSLLGGAFGYYMLSEVGNVLPYVLVIAASSFIYVALADLLPLLHKQRDNFLRQTALIGAGVAVVPLIGWFTH
ncbi:MAG: ZIP family metal transporter [Azonexus sp.]|jgi:zinc and cadmium transporter|uniref:ZIP family metal transporter n=1 Tax=Azonexus sp. TaxID=1872668 RepID=UPI002836F191|nr:ZIP family metal transporter [Azonexus sp.]MDR0777557.1 ZIP family metal transporter [Azonexus sp.]